MYDIVFLSYNETNAEDNWLRLCAHKPHAKRLHGIHGLHAAHALAAQLSTTAMFYVVDGDAEIDTAFDFDYTVADNKQDHVHVFRAINPVNSLIYGYGAVKLLPTDDVKSIGNRAYNPDVTTSINRKYEIVNIVSNVTRFNTSAFNAWRSAFRECAKLSSKIIPDQRDDKTNHRLSVWCNVGTDKPYGQHTLQGATAGKKFGMLYRNNPDIMLMINDTAALQKLFDKYHIG